MLMRDGPGAVEIARPHPSRPDPMTPDERNLLQTFLADLAATSPAGVDPEADAMIQAAMQRNPNAAYLLVQHAILADQALHAAQAQLAAQNSAPAGFLASQQVQPSPW